MKKRKDNELAFEDSLSDDWSRDIKVTEVPIGNRPLLYLGIIILGITVVITGQVVYLNMAKGAYYAARAVDNVAQAQETTAPRGEILDREGDVLADNKAAFAALLNARAFVNTESLRSSTIAAAQNIFGITPESFMELINQASADNFATPIVLAENVTSNQLVNLQALNLPTITMQKDFARVYPNGRVFSSVIGYTGRPTAADLKNDATLTASSFVGKTGIEAFYDSDLRGAPGFTIQYKNARGQTLGEGQTSPSKTGAPLTLTIDGGLQTFFYNRLANGLHSLGRTIGLGIAIDPQTGEVLSLINLPGFDNNVFSQAGSSSITEIRNLLTSTDKPLFDRAVSGYYNPGSTIKPLDAVAALKDGVIDSTREVFSPGYLMVPNPYSSSTPTKYADWQYQGRVNLVSAIAQSSDVYFYLVGGGSPVSTPMLNDASDYGIKGLGITRLNQWWQAFGLGTSTKIDMPSEAKGFLPTPAWKESRFGTPWLLGDTYNVSIGQGDLLVSPLQLISYIGAIGNGGKIYRPFVNASATPTVNVDLTNLLPEIQQVQVGMRATVTSPKGTAHTLNNLPLDVCAKTGSAQVHDNSQENALFVGYAPCDNPTIAILILIENSRQGSLNAVPIAGDVLNWYYQNRLSK
jgi:penicillin-binding protein 2